MRLEIWNGIKVIHHDFPIDQYYKEETQNKQICLHHLASGGDINTVQSDIDWWKSNKERVATCILISRDGTINTLFDSKYWAHHLGIKIEAFDKEGIKRVYKKRSNGKKYVANNEILNQGTIGLEIDSWGGLTERNGRYFSWANKEVKKENVVFYPNKYRGYNYFEKYTSEQIESIRLLLIHWKEEYGIDISYKGDKMFEVCKEALSGEEGVWSHTSYRSDKSDIHPQKELIKMLKEL